jgi:hypothetical protein
MCGVCVWCVCVCVCVCGVCVFVCVCLLKKEKVHVTLKRGRGGVTLAEVGAERSLGNASLAKEEHVDDAEERAPLQLNLLYTSSLRPHTLVA